MNSAEWVRVGRFKPGDTFAPLGNCQRCDRPAGLAVTFRRLVPTNDLEYFAVESDVENLCDSHYEEVVNP